MWSVIRYFKEYIKWISNGKPMLKYDGFHCGCCGTWVSKNFEVPTYKSVGRDWDTVDLCDNCIKEGEEYAEIQRGGKEQSFCAIN